MGVHQLKQDLHDVPGISSLTMTMLDGNQTYVFDRHAVTLPASASEAQVKAAIRAAAGGAAAVAPGPDGEASPATIPPSAALIPAVNVAPATIQPKATPVTTAPGAHALNIQQRLDNHAKKLDAILDAQLALLDATLGEQATAVQGAGEAIVSRIKSQTDDFNAIIGQFSNIGAGT